MTSTLRSVPDLSLDDALRCLSNERRRHTIGILDDHVDSLSLSEDTERVATRQYDVERQEVTGKQRKSVYTGLYQAHIGKLTEVNAIEFDDRAKVIAPAEKTEVLGQALSDLRLLFSTD